MVEDGSEGSGPGSEKRTRFLGLIGVLGGSGGLFSTSTLGSNFGTSTGSVHDFELSVHCHCKAAIGH